jgi:alkylresorcinol/alkylpyrone synthase
VQPLDCYLQSPGWSERNAAYLDGACALLVAAAQKALTAADLSGDAVATVSSTGLATPGIDARVAKTMVFRPDI